MKKKNSSAIRIWSVITVTALVIVVSVVCIIAAEKKQTAHAAVSTDGAAFIQAQEDVRVDQLEEKIIEAQTVPAQSLSADDPAAIFQAFLDSRTVIVGESRAAGFSHFGFLDESNVLGGIGWSIQEIPALYDQLAALSPSNIVFSFGINEIGRFPDTPVYYYDVSIFMEDLDRFMADIRGFLPDAKFYVNSIVPVTDAACAEYPGYAIIPDWNKALKEHYEKTDVGFIDISDLCKEHADLYIEDGMHFTADFYPYWGAAIMSEVLKPKK